MAKIQIELDESLIQEFITINEKKINEFKVRVQELTEQNDMLRSKIHVSSTSHAASIPVKRAARKSLVKKENAPRVKKEKAPRAKPADTNYKLSYEWKKEVDNFFNVSHSSNASVDEMVDFICKRDNIVDKYDVNFVRRNLSATLSTLFKKGNIVRVADKDEETRFYYTRKL